jgi:hypothetical protein
MIFAAHSILLLHVSRSGLLDRVPIRSGMLESVYAVNELTLEVVLPVLAGLRVGAVLTSVQALLGPTYDRVHVV